MGYHLCTAREKFEAEVVKAVDFQSTSVKKRTVVESSEMGVADKDQVDNTVKYLAGALSVNAEATVAPAQPVVQMGPAETLERQKPQLRVTESNESSSIDFANFDLRTEKASSSAPAAKAKGKKAATAGEKTGKKGTSAAKKLQAKPKPGKASGGGDKPSGGGGKGMGKTASAQPEWRQRAKKQRKMQQVDMIELQCEQLVEQFQSNDTVLNATFDKARCGMRQSLEIRWIQPAPHA